MTLRTRLFIAMLAVTALVMAGVFAFSRLAFEQGFLGYLKEQESRRVEAVAERFEQHYLSVGSWDALRGNERLMRRLVSEGWLSVERRFAHDRDEDEHQDDDHRHDHHDDDWKDRGRDPGHFSRPRPALDGHRPGRPPGPPFRVAILDNQNTLVVGSVRLSRKGVSTELKVQDETVGFLVSAPRHPLPDQLDQRFADRQQTSFLVIMAFAILASALLAFLMARGFTRPIQALQAGTRRLAKGDYEIRLGQQLGRRRKDEIARLVRDFDDLAAALEQTEQQRRAWVADISHELRTPLTVLRGEIEALQDGIRKPSPETLESLSHEVQRLGRLIDDLYELSMSDMGTLSYRKEPLNLVEVLDRVVHAHDPEIEGAGLTLDWGAKIDATVPVYADAQRLEQLFSNLIGNSCRYTDGGGRLRITLTTQTDKNTAQILVEDSAPGVPDAALEKLFDRFYRVEASRNRATGSSWTASTKTVEWCRTGPSTAM